MQTHPSLLSVFQPVELLWVLAEHLRLPLNWVNVLERSSSSFANVLTLMQCSFRKHTQKRSQPPYKEAPDLFTPALFGPHLLTFSFPNLHSLKRCPHSKQFSSWDSSLNILDGLKVNKTKQNKIKLDFDGRTDVTDDADLSPQPINCNYEETQFRVVMMSQCA